MLHEQFELKNAANTVETAASRSKMLQIPPTCCKFYGKWKVSSPKCCKDSWNGSFQLQNAATGKENVQKMVRSMGFPLVISRWEEFPFLRMVYDCIMLYIYCNKIPIVYLLYIYYDFDILVYTYCISSLVMDFKSNNISKISLQGLQLVKCFI